MIVLSSTHACDLLPIPWLEFQSRLDQGESLELAGKARGFDVVLLAAPRQSVLTKLVVGSRPVERMRGVGGSRIRTVRTYFEMSCVLRVSGNFDPEDVLAGSPLRPESRWNHGERNAIGHPNKNSGFNVLVSKAEFDDFSKQVRDAVRFLKRYEGELARLLALSGVAGASLDFGVAQRDQPAWSLRFPPELVELAGTLRLELEVSLYAVSGIGGFV